MPDFDDSRPSVTIRTAEFEQARSSSHKAQQALSLLTLFGAFAFTIGTIVLVLLPMREKTAPPTPENAQVVEQVASPTTETFPTISPTIEVQTVVEAVTPENTTNTALAPVVAPQQLTALLNSPLSQVSNVRYSVKYSPFTIATGDRPRSEFLEYTAVQGDTVGDIAARYGLTQESLAWCNDRRIVMVLRPGDVLRIPPVDGACHRVLGTREETVASVGELYKITDAYSIIDSPYNPQLFGLSPTEILPGGSFIFIPGGEGPLIVWNPGYTAETDASGVVRGLTFAPGQAGSCGNVAPAGGSFWGNPLPNGTWVRGFYSGHTGIDLSASTGTPIFAANSGNVLFSGWSKWGYGNAVVIEHGGLTSTLYGHMSDTAVGCGQFVSTGQVIGYVGSTGNSSGPHLHFEIRAGETPTDPSQTAGIGW